MVKPVDRNLPTPVPFSSQPTLKFAHGHVTIFSRQWGLVEISGYRPWPTPDRERSINLTAAKTKRLLRLSDCAPVKITWLWEGRLAAGKLTLFDGDPHQGKSLLTLDLVARLTAGRALPENEVVSEPISAVLVGTEDRPDDTVVPRLLAAGADLGRVTGFQGTARNGAPLPPRFPDDLPELRETLQETGARLLVIDPLSAVLKGSANGPEVRHVLEPLAEIAAETGAAVALVRHLNKGSLG